MEKALDNDSVDVVFPGLAIGAYAASVYYDLDNDGKMDTGMPNLARISPPGETGTNTPATCHLLQHQNNPISDIMYMNQ